MKGIYLCCLDPDLFFRLLINVAMPTDFWQNLLNYLHSARWRFETDSNIAIRNFDLHLYNSNIFATFYASFIVIGPLTQRLCREFL